MGTEQQVLLARLERVQEAVKSAQHVLDNPESYCAHVAKSRFDAVTESLLDLMIDGNFVPQKYIFDILDKARAHGHSDEQAWDIVRRLNEDVIALRVKQGRTH